MNYNQKRHIELLKLSQDLKNQGRSLYKENREEYLEFLDYLVAVEDHFLWESRYQISLSMEDFLNRKIDGEEFYDRIDVLRNNLINKWEKLDLELTSGSKNIKAFQPDERSKKLTSKNFSGFLTTLYCQCDNFEEDFENDEFYNSIKNWFLNWQEALNEA